MVARMTLALCVPPPGPLLSRLPLKQKIGQFFLLGRLAGLFHFHFARRLEFICLDFIGFLLHLYMLVLR